MHTVEIRTHEDDARIPEDVRVRWVVDDEPYDPGDTDHCEAHKSSEEDCEECTERRTEIERSVDLYGVLGCIVERHERRARLDVSLNATEDPKTYAEAMAILNECGDLDTRPVNVVELWEQTESLWGIVGDDDYRREVEKDLLSELDA